MAKWSNGQIAKSEAPSLPFGLVGLPRWRFRLVGSLRDAAQAGLRLRALRGKHE